MQRQTRAGQRRGERHNKKLPQEALIHSPTSPRAHPQLILCGWDEVAIWGLDGTSGGVKDKLWSWRGRGRDDIPTEFHDRFDTTAECKPAEDGRKLLITSSGGAVAVVDRRQDKVVFHARAANAHSAEILPNNRLAVAASHSPDGTGDRLFVFDLARPDHQVLSTELPWGHGVVWDALRHRLWALSTEDIRCYALEQWSSQTPQLARIAVIGLPERDGHDLYPVPGTRFLSVSTRTRCWHFCRDTMEFMPHPLLAEAVGVKSICQHPNTGQVVYIQGTQDHWWSERVHFLDPDKTMHVPGEHFYKARWSAPG